VRAGGNDHTLAFVEEPADPFDIGALREISQRIDIPIAVGERVYTRYGFRPVLESRAADILQPDIGNTGGIMETKKIAAMAEAYDVAVAPHCPLGPIALAASLLVALTVIPALGSLFITRKPRVERETAIQRVYTPVLTWALAYRAITLVVAFLLFAGRLRLVIPIPKGFLPPINANHAQVSVKLPAGASLRRTDLDTGHVEQVLVPCGHTLASVCPACAERNKSLRAAQCREGWHLEEEPHTAADPATEEQKWWITQRAEAQQVRDLSAAVGDDPADVDELITELDAQIAKAGIRGKAAPAKPGATNSAPAPAAPAPGARPCCWTPTCVSAQRPTCSAPRSTSGSTSGSGPGRS